MIIGEYKDGVFWQATPILRMHKKEAEFFLEQLWIKNLRHDGILFDAAIQDTELSEWRIVPWLMEGT